MAILRTTAHPETLSDEVFLTNSSFYGQDVFWETKRIGEIAYTTKWEVIPFMVPVFVKREELEKKFQALP